MIGRAAGRLLGARVATVSGAHSLRRMGECGPRCGAAAVARLCVSASASTSAPHSAAETAPRVVLRDEEDGIATLLLNRGPVNSLDTTTLAEIETGLRHLAEQEAVRGVVLTSNVPGIFSAGLDIMEMWNPEASKLETFWTQLQDTFRALYTFPKPIVAAVNGHSPAGGCLLALCCDYRVMSSNPKFTIGLNEAALGIVAPPWLVDLFVQAVGPRQADLMLQLGTLVSGAEALALGVVDEVADDVNVHTRCGEQLSKLMAVPNQARHDSKMAVRRHLLADFDANRADDVEHAVRFIRSSAVQATLSSYMEQLKQRSAAK